MGGTPRPGCRAAWSITAVAQEQGAAQRAVQGWSQAVPIPQALLKGAGKQAVQGWSQAVPIPQALLKGAGKQAVQGWSQAVPIPQALLKGAAQRAGQGWSRAAWALLAQVPADAESPSVDQGPAA